MRSCDCKDGCDACAHVAGWKDSCDTSTHVGITLLLCRGCECRYDPDVLLEQVVQSALVRHGSEKAAAKSLAATAALFNRSERTVADAVSKVRSPLHLGFCQDEIYTRTYSPSHSIRELIMGENNWLQPNIHITVFAAFTPR